MAQRRVNISALEVLTRTNDFLRLSPDPMQRERLAIASFTEGLLINANVYAGFMYLDSAGMQREEGIVVDFEDESRRMYYTHHRLRP